MKLDCIGEAREVLQASLNNPPIKHAVLSLRALRQDLETSGDNPRSVALQTSIYHYGLQHYSLALQGLASNLSCIGFNGLRSALLCCQILISIEQVRKNYAAMAQHIVRGLSIIHKYRARPELVITANKIMPAHHDQLPFLDVFIIKLFAAPCNFAEPTTDRSATTSSACLVSPHRQPVVSRDLRTIAPDNRAELLRIATLTLEFLSKTSQVESVQIALRLLSEKAYLLESLKLWLINLDLVQTKIGSNPEPISVSFLRFFYLILRIVLLGTLESSTVLDAELQIEKDRLQSVASTVGERVQTYITCSGTSSAREGRFIVR